MNTSKYKIFTKEETNYLKQEVQKLSNEICCNHLCIAEENPKDCVNHKDEYVLSIWVVDFLGYFIRQLFTITENTTTQEVIMFVKGWNAALLDVNIG